MAVEPGLVDANVLVYGLDAQAPQHVASRTLLEAGRDGSATLYTSLQILCEFYSIVTNSRRVARPRSAAEAVQAITELLVFLEVLPVPASTVGVWMELSKRHQVTAADIFDLQIVATMLANSVQRIYTFNAEDFRVFSELEVVTP